MIHSDLVLTVGVTVITVCRSKHLLEAIRNNIVVADKLMEFNEVSKEFKISRSIVQSIFKTTANILRASWVSSISKKPQCHLKTFVTSCYS